MLNYRLKYLEKRNMIMLTMVHGVMPIYSL
jgi:hypothetical protein